MLCVGSWQTVWVSARYVAVGQLGSWSQLPGASSVGMQLCGLGSAQLDGCSYKRAKPSGLVA